MTIAPEHPILDEDNSVEVVKGNADPFTMLPVWIALSGVSSHAKALYWHLAMHLNTRRLKDDDREVWPSKETLAGFLGIKKPSGIDPYMRELVDIQAVVVVRRRQGPMRTRNRYVVYTRVPDGWRGPRDLDEFYDQRPERA